MTAEQLPERQVATAMGEPGAPLDRADQAHTSCDDSIKAPSNCVPKYVPISADLTLREPRQHHRLWLH